MKSVRAILPVAFLAVIGLVLVQCGDEDFLANSKMKNPNAAAIGGNGGGMGGPGGGGETETAGNNLSFPVLWSDGVEKTLRTAPAGYTGVPMLGGAWWYVWGENPIDPQAPIYSCDPTLVPSCLPVPAPADLYKAYLQKDEFNYWEAYNATPAEATYIDSVDWGDNLESVDFSTTSKVRVEIGLYQNLLTAVTEYAMRHVSGWGTDEVHGLQTSLNNEVVYGPGTQATVYTPNARLTIQKITSSTGHLDWDPHINAWIGDCSAPVFNQAIYQASDGPTYFNAEVNVKGKIIYGYNWNVRTTGSGTGLYRITFSFDGPDESRTLNTFFDSETAIIVPAEEVEVSEAPGGGGVAYLDDVYDITYIDVNITSNRGGGGKGGQGSPRGIR